MSFRFALNLASAFSVVFPASAAIYRYRRLKLEMKILAFLFFITLLDEIYSFIQVIRKMDVHWAQHLYTPLEYTLTILAFSFWVNNSLLKKTMRISIPIFIAICIISIFILPNLHNLNTFTASLSSVVYVLVSAYMILAIQNELADSVASDNRFWMSSALLIGSAGSLVYFSFHDFVFSWTIWGSHAVVNVIASIMFAIGFICQQRR